MLAKKYNPVFSEMKESLADKRLEYMTFLTKQLNSNKERVQLEKESYKKLIDSFNNISDRFKSELE
jgi:hypothetical protein